MCTGDEEEVTGFSVAVVSTHFRHVYVLELTGISDDWSTLDPPLSTFACDITPSHGGMSWTSVIPAQWSTV
jgi:hypothetical protein